MTKQITYQDLYKSVNELRIETTTKLDIIEEKIERNYATREEVKQQFAFLEDKIKPIQTMLYSVIFLIVSAVIVALLSLVIKK